MPEIKVVTEVAGRVCALPVEAGSNIGDGDEIAFVEAMKMEITGHVDGGRQNQVDSGQD
ncbi:biotin carboxyl carrier protein [Bradyrhizobium sp. JR6.1]